MKFLLKLIVVLSIPFLCGISDNFLLYTPELFSKAENYQFLKTISRDSQWMGLMLGLICIPMLYYCYIFLVDHVDMASRKALISLRNIVKVLIFIGCLVHAMYYFLIPGIALYPWIIVGAKILELLFVAFFVFFSWKLLQLSTNTSNVDLYKIRFFNPIGYLILCIIFCVFFPIMGIRLLVSAFNMSFLWVLLGYFFCVFIPQKINKIPKIT